MLTPFSKVEGISWPVIPTPNAAIMMAMQYQLEQSQWLPTVEIERRQFEQAAILLRHAVNTVPYYRERYAGLIRSGPLDWDSWRTLPFLERSDIQSKFEQLKSASFPDSHGKVVDYGSSGSTGRPIKALGTGTTHFFWLCISLRDHVWHKRDLSKLHGGIRTKVKAGRYPGWGEWSDGIITGPSTLLDIRTDVDKQLDWLITEKPDYLITHPSNLQALVKRSAERNLSPIGLLETRTFGEMLKPGLRELIRQEWNVPLSDMYSAEEVGYIALQCPETENYHVQSENLLVEILNEQGVMCKPGEVGGVFVTTLHNFAMPLIRYRILDHAEVGEPCPCGRGLPTLKRIVGRQRNMIVLPDGRSHWPSFPGSAWIAIAPVLQFQLTQRDLHTIEIKLVCARPLTKQEETGLRNMLTEKLGHPFQYLFNYQNKIEAAPNGKFEDFISHVNNQ